MKTTYLSFHFQMNLKERVISEFKMDFMKSCLNSGLNSTYSRPLSTFVSSHLEVFKDRLLLKTRFNALTSKPLYSCCTLERSIENWPISRTGY